ncbi:MAG: hypothetical protein ACHREM_18945 [Polyangiales bacterium]
MANLGDDPPDAVASDTAASSIGLSDAADAPTSPIVTCATGPAPYRSMADVPIQALCASSPGDVFATLVGDSIMLFSTTPDGCGTERFFDQKTQAFQGAYTSCGNDPWQCTSVVDGFVMPTTPWEYGTFLCSTLPPPSTPPPPAPRLHCTVNDVSGFDRSCATAADCVAVPVGVLCDGASACGTTAVNVSELAASSTITSSVALVTGDCTACGTIVCWDGSCGMEVPLK